MRPLVRKMRQSIAGWSSSVARRAHNPKVTGSNPVPATRTLKDLEDFLLSPFFYVWCHFCPSFICLNYYIMLPQVRLL